MTAINAIQTMYAGTLFRSRLEARWAVFFDELNIKWEFEPEGFLLKPCGCWDGDNCEPGEGECQRKGTRYLPDFFLSDTQTWVEVKGTEERLNRDLLAMASDWGTALPGVRDSLGTTRGILVLGSIPRPGSLYGHALIQHRKGVWMNRAIFEHAGFSCFEINEWFGDGYAGHEFKGPMLEPIEYEHHDDPWVSAAYSAARSARFEHSDREVWSR